MKRFRRTLFGGLVLAMGLSVASAHEGQESTAHVDYEPRFHAVLEALDKGDVERLRELLREHPDLVKARIASRELPYDAYFHRAPQGTL